MVGFCLLSNGICKPETGGETYSLDQAIKHRLPTAVQPLPFRSLSPLILRRCCLVTATYSRTTVEKIALDQMKRLSLRATADVSTTNRRITVSTSRCQLTRVVCGGAWLTTTARLLTDSLCLPVAQGGYACNNRKTWLKQRRLVGRHKGILPLPPSVAISQKVTSIIALPFLASSTFVGRLILSVMPAALSMATRDIAT